VEGLAGEVNNHLKIPAKQKDGLNRVIFLFGRKRSETALPAYPPRHECQGY
jgi:hypothetical protein